MPIITDTEELKNYCTSLEDNEFITVDTEFSREKTYYPKLCLIQVADDNKAVIIDALAENLDLSPFLEVLLNKKILKVLHASRQDMEIFYKLLNGNLPEPVFDTQIAASICGFGDSASYASLVKELTKSKIDKSLRVTDWTKRPLSRRQIDYALGDVTHLREVYRKLKDKLEALGNEHWIAEEMTELLKPENYFVDSNLAYKKIKIRGESKAYIKLMQKLAKWREETAQRKDIPRGFLVKDQLLLEIAAIKPKTIEDLYSIRSTGGIDKEMAAELIRVINEEGYYPIDSPLTKDEETKYPKGGSEIQMLKLLLMLVSEEEGVAESVIANTGELATLLHSNDREEIANLKIMRGWRFEMFGKHALKLKEGKIALVFDNSEKKIKIQEL